jgi:hypothetical protein
VTPAGKTRAAADEVSAAALLRQADKGRGPAGPRGTDEPGG